MPIESKRVAVVVDPSCENLQEIASRWTCWVAASDHNRTETNRLWAEKRSLDLTIYDVQNVEEREENLVSEIETIELHHPYLQELLIFGTPFNIGLQSRLGEVGYRLEEKDSQLTATKV